MSATGTGTRARVREYKRLLRETARQLGESVDAEVTKHVAAFKTLRETLVAKMLLGEVIDPGYLVRIDEVLKKYLPEGKPLEVSLTVVHKELPSLPAPDPEPAPEPPPSTDTAAKDKAPAATPAPPAAKVIPLRDLRANDSASDFHSQYAEGPGGGVLVAPLKRLQAQPPR